MARKKKCKVFVSYSRHDESIVRGLVGFMKLGTDELVFLDVTSLEPGEIWKEEIEKAITDALTFVVCWCCRSKQSAFVADEIDVALKDENKRIVPVLFCSTPLPSSLANRQWQDLRGQVLHECDGHDPNPSVSLLGADPAKKDSYRDAGKQLKPSRVFLFTTAVASVWGGFVGLASVFPIVGAILSGLVLAIAFAFALRNLLDRSSRASWESNRLAGLVARYFTIEKHDPLP